MGSPSSSIKEGGFLVMSEHDWQSLAALAVVGVTALAFLWRALRQKKGGGCGSCGCATKPQKKLVGRS